MPEPPLWLREWAPIFWPLFGLVLLPFVRNFVVKPIKTAIEEHAWEHTAMANELQANGSERLLPEELQNVPLRTLIIKTWQALREHEEETAPLVTQYRQDLADRARGPASDARRDPT